MDFFVETSQQIISPLLEPEARYFPDGDQQTLDIV